MSQATSTFTVADGVDKAAPLLAETEKLFSLVDAKDLDGLAALCREPFGYVDVTETGKPALVSAGEWEQWTKSMFERLRAGEVSTGTHVTKYDCKETGEMAMSAVEFEQWIQSPRLGDQKHRFACVVTIVWSKEGGAWKCARRHLSVLRKL